MTHSYAICSDSFIYHTHLCVCDMTHSYTILIYMYVTWLMYISYSFMCKWHDPFIYHTDACVCDMTHSYIILIWCVWHDSFIHHTHLCVCYMTHLQVQRGLLKRGPPLWTRLIHIHVKWLIHSHDSSIPHTRIHFFEKWTTHLNTIHSFVCDMTHLYVCDMTHSYVIHGNSFICIVFIYVYGDFDLG